MKSTSDLYKESRYEIPQNRFPEHPARFISNKISPTTGHDLQLQTRANQKMAEAVLFAVPYTDHFQSKFMGNLIDTLMRMGVSMEGAGRLENIDCLRASGTTPDAYYNQENEQKKKSFGYIRREETSDE